MDDVVIATGLFFGGLLITAVAAVWFRHQKLGFNGGFMGALGVILIGLSLWTRAEVKLSPGGLEARFETLESQMDSVAASQQLVTETVAEVAEGVETTQEQVVALSHAVENPLRVRPQTFDSIRRRIQPGAIDLDRLDSARVLTPRVDPRLLSPRRRGM